MPHGVVSPTKNAIIVFVSFTNDAHCVYLLRICVSRNLIAYKQAHTHAQPAHTHFGRLALNEVRTYFISHSNANFTGQPPKLLITTATTRAATTIAITHAAAVNAAKSLFACQLDCLASWAVHCCRSDLFAIIVICFALSAAIRLAFVQQIHRQ